MRYRLLAASFSSLVVTSAMAFTVTGQSSCSGTCNFIFGDWGECRDTRISAENCAIGHARNEAFSSCHAYNGRVLQGGVQSSDCRSSWSGANAANGKDITCSATYYVECDN